MSYLTGRYVHSHGATWNGALSSTNVSAISCAPRAALALVGKTHMEPDAGGAARLGVDKMSSLGMQLRNAD